MVVLAPVFWLQSRNTLPPRSDLVIFQTTSRGCSPVSSWAISWAWSRTSSELSVPGSAAYRCRPLLPEVTGAADRPRSDELVAHQQRHLAALPQPRGMTRVEVDDQPVRVLRLPVRADRPLVHVQLEGGQVGEVGEVGQPVDDRVADRVAAAAGAGRRDGHRVQPLRRPGRQVLLEELHVAGAVRPADPGHRAVREVRQEHPGDPRVVVEHLALGGAGGRVHHLAEVADPQRPAVDVDQHLVGLLLSHRGPPGPRG